MGKRQWANRLGIAIAVLAGSVFCAQAHQPDPTDPSTWRPAGAQETDTHNAALLYWRAMWDLPQTLGQWPAYEDDPAWTPPQELSDALAEEDAQGLIGELIYASRQTECDFEPEYERGLRCFVREISMLEVGARALCADARRLRLAGDADGAAIRAAAVLRMARHLQSDRFTLTCERSVEIAMMGVVEATAALDAGVAEASLNELREALDRLPDTDRFGVADMLAFQRDNLLTFLSLDMLDDGSTPTEASPDNPVLILGVKKVTPAYDRLIDAWATHEREQVIADVRRGIDADEYGYATLFLPLFPRFLDRIRDGARRLDELEQLIEETEPTE